MVIYVQMFLEMDIDENNASTTSSLRGITQAGEGRLPGSSFAAS